MTFVYLANNHTCTEVQAVFIFVFIKLYSRWLGPLKKPEEL